jgi:DNA-binding NtrC family response regulator
VTLLDPVDLSPLFIASFCGGKFCEKKRKKWGADSCVGAHLQVAMKRDVILLLDDDGDCANVACTAGSLLRLDVRFVRRPHDLFQMIQERSEDVVAVVLDVDPGFHGMAVMETLAASDLTLPAIIISSLEVAHLFPAAKAYRANACLGKPVSPERLAMTISACLEAPKERSHRCDRSHRCEGCVEHVFAPNDLEIPTL